MLKVWTNAAEAGLLARRGERGSTFAYTLPFQSQRAVSVTMPVGLASTDRTVGVAPIFEMNLPEGVLREKLRLTFAKATGRFDDLDLLAIVGRSQVGRIRYSDDTKELNDAVPFQSVDEILESRRSGDLYKYLIEKFAVHSGISGVQPKVLIRDTGDNAREHVGMLRGATHIVKFWDASEYPEMAANEYFCLQVAMRCGLSVPNHRLSQDGAALVVDRFDLPAPDAVLQSGNAAYGYLGFEDFCVLNARRTEEKYRGSYESSILKRFQEFAGEQHTMAGLEKLFLLIALNCAIRNGDAHLKNFGICYESVVGEAWLAPAFDLVTTTAYMPKDEMALTLNGTTRWPTRRVLTTIGNARALLSGARIKEIFQSIADAMADIVPRMELYARENPRFAAVSAKMIAEWQIGRASLLA
jgi:serine/threonine-protein kinase HipA